MATDLATTSAAAPEQILPEGQEDAARVLVFGGVSSSTDAFSASEPLAAQIAKQQLLVGALHQSDLTAATWLMQAGAGLISLAGMRGESADASALGFIGATAIGAGETEAMANRPFILCINGIRLGFVSFAEQRAGVFSGKADALRLMAFDQVRMLLNECDHVIVLVRAGLDQAELPLPEWRARYRRWIDAGASAVVDTGNAKGWEAYKNGLIFYGLGSPASADSLGLFLTLRRNGRLDYEARALQNTAGVLNASVNEKFKQHINAQNRLYTDEKAYLRAVDEMCRRLYCEQESTQKRGVLGLFSSHADEEQRLLSLLENESLRLMTLRALRLNRAPEKDKRENVKRA